MNLMGLFRSPQNELEKGGTKGADDNAGIQTTCPSCNGIQTENDLWDNFNVCIHCGHHFRISPRQRLDMLIDPDSFTEMNRAMRSRDILGFPGYDAKLRNAQLASREREGVLCGTAKILEEPCAVFIMDPKFMMGSMGTVVGEKITQLFEYATEHSMPVVGYTVSGGARMQEGILSLMQMAKTSAAVKRHNDAGNFYLAVLTDPTTGGVTASFAMEGDIIMAEPGATIGFAGARVIEQTIRRKLPQGFQKAEFLLEHGFVDLVVPRKDHQKIVAELLRLNTKTDGFKINAEGLLAKAEDEIEGPDNQEAEEPPKGSREPKADEQGKHGKEKASHRMEDLVGGLIAAASGSKAEAGKTAYDKLQLARAKGRPTGASYIRKIFTDFVELHGDRRFADDPAIVGGIARLAGNPVTVIAIEKGADTKDKVRRNFGSPNPEGYRKALRLMKEAEKFKRPVICFIDTAGAFCGMGAEERGQGQAIAENLMEMSALKVPIISVFVGEGGSGGALALAVADRLWILENAVYSVISPEGCASILWKDAKKVKEAADCLKITAQDMLKLGIVEQVIEETKDFEAVYGQIKHNLIETLEVLTSMPEEELLRQRYERFRKF